MAGGKKITSAKYGLFGALRKKVHVLQRVAKFQESAPKIETKGKINILRHSRRFFRCACKALLPAAP
ncbi:TPA: hypothetical protein GND80_004467 [Salmonella enterica subsp. houtenae serovar 45:g,z51:-]|uniref:Uncharacterized protein n=1 Tax=Salmonella enterica subsp. houtenae serovar 45:g,z51:- TaxID=1967611 RepID=A0A753BBW3_SALHO|nr:hypothetical protein [Salmonella enterica subsp. houtenae serovar 45:g,z51:-]